MSGIDPELYGSSWYVASAVEAPERGPLPFDHDIDVCVVGAGLAGLTVAREIARRGWSVMVLEAKRIAWSASGRNCGFVLPGFSERIKDVVERVGFDAARTLWALSETGVDYVRDTISETGMPGVEPVDRRGEAARSVPVLDLLGVGEGAEHGFLRRRIDSLKLQNVSRR